MQNKLQQLTEKIYKEGISKGNQEAERIIAEAKAEAEEIVANANKESKIIIDEAKKKAEELSKNMRSELQLSSRQAVNALKQQITSLIETKLVETPLKNAFNDQAFVNGIIESVVKNWNLKSGAIDLQVLLPKDKEKEAQAYFNNKAKDLLNKGLQLTFTGDISSGFEIGPKDGSFKISFSDQEFENFFKEYLRPRLIELLYGEK